MLGFNILHVFLFFFESLVLWALGIITGEIYGLSQGGDHFTPKTGLPLYMHLMDFHLAYWGECGCRYMYEY